MPAIVIDGSLITGWVLDTLLAYAFIYLSQTLAINVILQRR